MFLWQITEKIFYCHTQNISKNTINDETLSSDMCDVVNPDCGGINTSKVHN